ncbi:MAG TPA: hypothetical protein VLS51_08480 [Propionibacteriaceae bacterium]|nr:hypothetical protein [Propionibacteriaceae bacterium]
MDTIAISLDAPAQHWVIWEWISVSIPNLIMIVVMVLLFVAALLLPFPKGREES